MILEALRKRIRRHCSKCDEPARKGPAKARAQRRRVEY